MITSQIEGQPATSLWCDTMDTDMWCLYRQYSKLSCQTFCAVFSELWRVWTDPHIEEHCWRYLATLPMESYLRVDRPCTTHVWRDFFCDLLVCSCAACVFLLFSRVFMCGVRFSMVFLCVHVWREHWVRTVKCNVTFLRWDHVENHKM